ELTSSEGIKETQKGFYQVDISRPEPSPTWIKLDTRPQFSIKTSIDDITKDKITCKKTHHRIKNHRRDFRTWSSTSPDCKVIRFDTTMFLEIHFKRAKRFRICKQATQDRRRDAPNCNRDTWFYRHGKFCDKRTLAVIIKRQYR